MKELKNSHTERKTKKKPLDQGQSAGQQDCDKAERI